MLGSRRVRLSKRQYTYIRQRGLTPTPLGNIDENDNIFEQEHQFQQGQFNRKEKSRWRNTEHYSLPTRRVKQMLADKDREFSFQNDPSVNILQSHRRMLSPQDNSIFRTERSQNILDTSSNNNNILQSEPDSLNLNRLTPDTKEILSAPSLFSSSNPYNNENIFVELRRDKQQKIKTKINFW